MKKNTIKSRSTGFTVIELMLGLMIFAFIILFSVNTNTKVNAHDLENGIATQSNNFSNIAVNYIQNNYVQILKQTANNPIYITTNQLASAGYYPTGTASINALGQAPCIYIANRNNHLEPLLFFVNTANTSKHAPLTQVENSRIISMIGAKAGYINDSGNAVSTGNTWQINNAQNLLSPSQCGGTVISTNSLVINLSLMADFNTNTSSDQSIYRTNDNLNSSGESANYNTLQTDVTLHQRGYNGLAESYHALALTTNLKITANPNDTNGVVINNGGLIANNVIPSASNDYIYNGQITLQSGATCTAQQLGAMASQTTQNPASRLIANQLQCTFNALICQGADPNGNPRNGYCYLPIADTQLTLSPNNPNASCPQGYFISGTASVSPVCTCNYPATPTSGTYIQYQGFTAFGVQVNVAAYGRCNCSDGSQGAANINQITCSSSNPTINYDMN